MQSRSAADPLRLRALYDGKLLFSPVPYLTKGFPYLRIDPAKLAAAGVDFETAATAQGFMQYGEPVGFEDMPKLDFCVVGCVAVTREGGRTGKGAGFADLEQGIFRELGLVDASTPIATTVHSIQVVESEAVVIESHDSALHYIATESELIETRTTHPSPGRRLDKVRPDQFARHPVPRRAQDLDRGAAAVARGAQPRCGGATMRNSVKPSPTTRVFRAGGSGAARYAADHVG